ncbi:two-component regulator propeller domain-containing protein [Chryseobacterium wanjuense]
MLFLFSQNYNVSYYTTDNGLPQNSVKDITKDKYGFIWLTTENGVVRYDGTNFVGYKNILANNQRFAYFYGNIQNDNIFANDCYDGTIIINKKIPIVIKA